MTKLPPEHDGTASIPAVVYAAKSTEDERGSVPSQLSEIREAISLAGGRHEIFADHDESASGFTGPRGPGLARCIAAAEDAASKHGRAELWAFDPDRFARGDGKRARHLGGLYFSLLAAGVTLRVVQGDDDLADPIRAVLRGERNRQDSEAKSGHVRRGLRATAARGDWQGGILPDGYRVIHAVDERGRVSRIVELDPSRSEIYRLHFTLALAGWSDRAIVLELDRRGFHTRPRKAGHRPRPFDANRVGQTLSNPFYAGLSVYRGEVVGPGNWPALVSTDDFEQIRATRRLRSHGNTPPAGRPPEGYVLARVAACGACSSPMDIVTGRHVRKDGTRPRRYVCRTHRQRPQDCSAQPIDATLVDRAFVANLERFLGDVAAWRSQLVTTREAETTRVTGEVDRARTDLDTCQRIIEAAQRRYAAALAAGDDDRAAAIEDALAAQRTEQRRAETRLQAATAALADVAHDPGIDPMLDFFNSLRAELAGRVNSAYDDIKRLNAVVHEYFGLGNGGRVALTTTEAGVEILPVLNDATTHRILLGQLEWPYGIDVGETTEEEVEDGVVLRRTPVDVIAPPAVLATGSELIMPPPLRVIHATSQNAPSPS